MLHAVPQCLLWVSEKPGQARNSNGDLALAFVTPHNADHPSISPSLVLLRIAVQIRLIILCNGACLPVRQVRCASPTCPGSHACHVSCAPAHAAHDVWEGYEVSSTLRAQAA